MPSTPEQRLRTKFPTFVKNARALPEPQRSRVLALAELLAEFEDRLRDSAPGKELQARSLEVASFATAVAGTGAIDSRWEDARHALREVGVPLSLLMGYVDGLIAGHLRPQIKDWAQFRQHARQTALAPGWIMALALGADPAQLETRRADLEKLAHVWAVAGALRELPEAGPGRRLLVPTEEALQRGLAPEELYSKNLSENAKQLYKALGERALTLLGEAKQTEDCLPAGPTREFAKNALKQQFAILPTAVNAPDDLLRPRKTGGWLAKLLRRS